MPRLGFKLEREGLQKGLKVPVSPQVKTVVLGVEGSGTCVSEMYNVNGSVMLCGPCD